MVNVIRSDRFDSLKKSNITFGNERSAMYSTYQLDYCRSQYNTLGNKIMKPPAAAPVGKYDGDPFGWRHDVRHTTRKYIFENPVFTEKSSSTSQYQWLSTNNRDHCNFGEPVRRQEYERYKQAYKQTELLTGCLNRDVMVGQSLRHAIHPSSMVTSHELDFRDFKVPAPSISQQMNIIQSAPKIPESIGMKHMTTAQQAYKWPTPFKQVRFSLGS